MKKVKLVIYEPLINKAIGNELNLMLDDSANILDLLCEADKNINSKRSSFPVPNYQSLLHMVYNPVENRFYKQVAVAGYASGQMLNVRENPKQQLPEAATIILIPAGGCISEWEEALDYREFSQAISGQINS